MSNKKKEVEVIGWGQARPHCPCSLCKSKDTEMRGKTGYFIYVGLPVTGVNTKAITDIAKFIYDLFNPGANKFKTQVRIDSITDDGMETEIRDIFPAEDIN